MYLINWNSAALAQSLGVTFISSVFLKIDILQWEHFQFEMDTQLPYCAVTVVKVRVVKIDFFIHSYINRNVCSYEDVLWWFIICGL